MEVMNLDEAIILYKKCLELDSTNIDVYLCLLNIYKTCDKHEARELYNTAK
jgi:two-component SAPR family response regulator